MLDKIKSFVKEDPSWAAFLGSVFAAGFTLPLTRLLLVVSLVLSAFHSKTKRSPFRRNLPTLGWILYFIVALIVTAIMAMTNTDPLIVPDKGLGKITKLLWYIAIPLTIVQVNSTERFRLVLKVFVCGCLVTAFFVTFLNPLFALLQVNWPHDLTAPANETQRQLVEWSNRLGITESIRKWVYSGYRAPDYMASMLKLGTMQDSQRLMVALPAALCLCIDARGARMPRRERVLGVIFLVMLFCGLMLTFKRGPIMCAIFVCAAIILSYMGAKGLIALALCCTIFAVHPAVRLRFAQLPEEFSQKKGGRALMWTQIVPAVHEEHPYGIGFRALTNEKMRQHGKNVEQRQNHVHSTPLQSFVDFGWIGVAVYLFWMGAALAAAIKSLIATRIKGVSQPAVRYVPIAMLTALMLYGMIEYNLADAEIVILYSLAMGMASFRPKAGSKA